MTTLEKNQLSLTCSKLTLQLIYLTIADVQNRLKSTNFFTEIFALLLEYVSSFAFTLRQVCPHFELLRHTTDFML
jgi:hypothetical protein